MCFDLEAVGLQVGLGRVDQESEKRTSLSAADVSPLVLMPDLAEKKSRLLLMNFPI